MSKALDVLQELKLRLYNPIKMDDLQQNYFGVIEKDLNILEIILPFIEDYFLMYIDEDDTKQYMNYRTYVMYCNDNHTKRFWNEEQYNTILKWLKELEDEKISSNI